MAPNATHRAEIAEMVLKCAGTLLIPVVLAMIGYFGNKILQHRQEVETRARLYSELMSKREDADTALRKDMLRAIIEAFFKPTAGSLEEKVLNLELLTYNFHESLYLAPLFYHVEREIAAANAGAQDATGASYKQRLRRVARSVVKRQLTVLQSAGATLHGTIGLGEIRAPLAALPAEVTWPTALQEKIRYHSDPAHPEKNYLAFRGVMSTDECRTVLALSADPTFRKAVTALSRKSLHLHHTAYPLDAWPAEVDIPDAFAKKLEYDDSTHLVVFKGIMSSDEHDALLGLSPEEPFQKAIEALYRTSQQLREQRDDRTYQLHMVQEATLSVDHIDRHYKLTVLEINLRTQEIKVRLEVRAAPRDAAAARPPGPVRPTTSEEPLATAEFWVGFYDFPMVDNIRLPNDQRCAVVLDTFEEPMTQYTLVCFPASRASLKEKPYYEDVLQRVLHERAPVPDRAPPRP
jgi:hypothetical protein